MFLMGFINLLRIKIKINSLLIAKYSKNSNDIFPENFIITNKLFYCTQIKIYT